MKITIIGASGFVGKNVTKQLLEKGYFVRAVAPDIERLSLQHKHLEKLSGDVFSLEDMNTALAGADIAYYFVHMMNGRNDDFYDKEMQAAETFGMAAKAQNVSRIIYMSGLGSDKEKLSQHLASRHNTGKILRNYGKLVIEFRASMIIGPGSISFEIVQSLIKKLPLLVLPKWSKTLTQPIGLFDALQYLVAGAEIQVEGHEIIEIGGPEKMSYQSFLHRYAEFLGKKVLLLRISILPEWLAGHCLDIFTPRGVARVGRHMVASFRNEMTVTNNRAQELFPNIHPQPVEESFNLG